MQKQVATPALGLLGSFIPVAAESHFPIQNLPYGTFRRRTGELPRIGVAIGDYVLDLAALAENGCFSHPQAAVREALSQSTLNAFMALGPLAWAMVRVELQNLLSAQNSILRDHAALRDAVLIPQSQVTLCMPVDIGDYTDFYASKEHASNVGTLWRGKDNALMPNWTHMPIGYHGRASSVVISGTPVRRPSGQILSNGASVPQFGPSGILDFELEMGFFIGPGNALGRPVSVRDAASHIFGLVLVNDWSARDIQKWEYQPLGPFLGKSFATSLSPWIVPLAALAPFRVPSPAQDPAPLPYLQSVGDWALNIELAVALKTAAMNAPAQISRSNMRYLYWNMLQQLAHHSSNGCNLRPGDLLASGTISGPTPDSFGSLLELTWNGANPLKLPSGEERKFLEDGDTVVMNAYAQGEGYRVGFGEVRGTVAPALKP